MKRKSIPIPNDARLAQLIQTAAEPLGGQNRLAEVLQTSPQVICKWKKIGRIPAEWVITFSQKTGIPVHQIRPDIYPRKYIV